MGGGTSFDWLYDGGTIASELFYKDYTLEKTFLCGFLAGTDHNVCACSAFLAMPPPPPTRTDPSV